MQRFTLPRDLYHGKGALEALKEFWRKKAIVCVGGGSMKRNGFLDRAVNYLKEAGITMNVEVIDNGVWTSSRSERKFFTSNYRRMVPIICRCR